MVSADKVPVINVLLLAAAALVYVGAQATIAALGNTPHSSLPAPSTCPASSVNHITQTLPQQCLPTAWTGERNDQQPGKRNLSDHDNDTASKTAAKSNSSSISSATYEPTESSTANEYVSEQPSQTHTQPTSQVNSHGSASPSSREPPGEESDVDSESPFDNAHFLSFEEWKKNNLAKVGQSPDHLGGGKTDSPELRRRPGGIHNALDSLGEDAEIEIDFAGFVNPQVMPPGGRGSEQASLDHAGKKADNDQKLGKKLSSAHSRNRDAGVTCKERSNYASFDCAATMLKTNPQCKSSTSVLVENKDSYMLNECSADNKFFIVELCDDILVDTIVLANFEFFSSIFRTFRVSVSDRYPVKLDKWRELGIFEARNTREIQAFLIEEPQIWARYLRIEFLTHYGHEYYCPVSLLRVHGTTMMEEFNSELKSSRGDEEAEGDEGDSEGEMDKIETIHDVVTADVLRAETKTDHHGKPSTEIPASPSSTAHGPTQTTENDIVQTKGIEIDTKSTSFAHVTPFDQSSEAQLAAVTKSGKSQLQGICRLDEAPADQPSPSVTHSDPAVTSTSQSTPSSDKLAANDTASVYVQPSSSGGHTPGTAPPNSIATDIPDSAVKTIASSPSKIASQPSSSASPSHTSSTQPFAPNPTTQESFFKSVHKRLQLLESNSTLSLQYIEEQSRILRDAFAKVEKRQLSKTTHFLETLNTTVLNEVREFRTQYDQIWQSTVIELSSQRQQSQQEINALSSRLTLLADELLFQKRIAVLQFALVVICLGLAFFSRGSAASGYNYLEHVVNKSSLNLSSRNYGSHLETPPTSPPDTRPPSRYGFFSRNTSFRAQHHERSPSDESVGDAVSGDDRGSGLKSPSIECSPPTPTSLSEEDEAGSSPRRRRRHHQSGVVNGLLRPEDSRPGSSGSSGNSEVGMTPGLSP
ncbi:MAG: hypothetical protein Q9220_004564 [cf. Caloplaca sp. 1 TL-2023]